MFDIENYKLLGETRENVAMGRWTVGYFYRMSEQTWYIAYTEETEERKLIPAYSKATAQVGYLILSDEYEQLAGRIKNHCAAGGNVSPKKMEEAYYLELKRFAEARRISPETRPFARSIYTFLQTRDLQRAHFVDYVDHYSVRTDTGRGPRKDSIWLHENGYIILEGKVAQDWDVFLVGTKVDRLRSCYEEISEHIDEKIRSDESHYLSGDFCKLLCYWTRLKNGYIEKEICLEDLNADKIIDMYEAAVRDHEFPDEEGLQEIRDRVDRILMSMRESRG